MGSVQASGFPLTGDVERVGTSLRGDLGLARRPRRSPAARRGSRPTDTPGHTDGDVRWTALARCFPRAPTRRSDTPGWKERATTGCRSSTTKPAGPTSGDWPTSTAVARALRYGIGRLGENNPALVVHLENCVHTGTYCSYRPDPLSGVTWTL